MLLISNQVRYWSTDIHSHIRTESNSCPVHLMSAAEQNKNIKKYGKKHKRISLHSHSIILWMRMRRALVQFILISCCSSLKTVDDRAAKEKQRKTRPMRWFVIARLFFFSSSLLRSFPFIYLVLLQHLLWLIGVVAFFISLFTSLNQYFTQTCSLETFHTFFSFLWFIMRFNLLFSSFRQSNFYPRVRKFAHRWNCMVVW